MLIKPWQIASQATSSPPLRQPVDRSGFGRSKFQHTRSESDEEITPEISLTVPAVLAAFTILCEDISSLPLIMYQRNKNREKRTRAGEKRTRAADHPYYTLLHDTPNPEMTSMTFREIEMGHLLAWGNFYAQIIWDSKGVVAELWPLRPDRMTVRRLNGEKVYQYYSSDGHPYTFLHDEVWHIPAFGFDGLIGYSRIALARNSIGLAIAAERFGSKFFANDARPGVALKAPGLLSDTAYQRLSESWDLEHKGADKSHKTAILEEGLDIAEIGFPPEDVQFIETQKWTVAQLARVFRVPPHMIGDVEKSTSWGTGIDSQEQGYVNHTLRPWTTRVEQSASHQLLQPDERKIYYWEHLFDALMRGDLSTRYKTYVIAITNGIMSPNEIRQRENLEPYAGGDTYFHPLNLGPEAGGPEDPTEEEDQLETATARSRPLFLDAAQRVLKRESAELRDADQRWNAKGKSERFEAWARQFYQQDFPAFASTVFQPLIDARLLGKWRFENYLDVFCAERFDLALEGPDLTVLDALQFVQGLLS